MGYLDFVIETLQILTCGQASFILDSIICATITRVSYRLTMGEEAPSLQGDI